jgi:putative transposase
MPRKIRIVIPNEAHHITQRGNCRQRIFEEEKDYRQYLECLERYARENEVSIQAYCLMSNHIHVIGIPNRESSLGKLFNVLSMRYSQHVNRKRKTFGHVWQGRYFSCVLDSEHLYRAIRYVERNPVRAKLVKEAWEYKWSSAREHMGMNKERKFGLKESLKMDKEEWKKYLMGDDKEMTEEIRKKTQRGLVVGKESFIKEIEKRLNRSLECLNIGRPKRKGS